MNRTSRAFRPGASALEPRALLSAAQVAVSAVGTPRLSGRITGQYQGGQDNRAADAPLRVVLAGNGPVLGRSRMTGMLAFGGYRLAGLADVNGSLTLTNGRGSIKIQLSGPGGFEPVSGNRFELDASIVSGTGAYTNVRGIGSAVVAFGGKANRADPTPGPIGGQVAIVLNLQPPIR